MGANPTAAVAALIALLQERPEEDRVTVLKALARDLLPQRQRIELASDSGEAVGVVEFTPATRGIEVSDELLKELEERRRSTGPMMRAEDVMPYLESLTS